MVQTRGKSSENLCKNAHTTAGLSTEKGAVETCLVIKVAALVAGLWSQYSNIRLRLRVINFLAPAPEQFGPKN